METVTFLYSLPSPKNPTPYDAVKRQQHSRTTKFLREKTICMKIVAEEEEQFPKKKLKNFLIFSKGCYV